MVKTIASIFISALLLFLHLDLRTLQSKPYFRRLPLQIGSAVRQDGRKTIHFHGRRQRAYFLDGEKKGTARMGAAHFHRKRRLSIERSDRLFIRGKTRRRASENRSADRNDEKNSRFLRFPLRERILKPAVYPISDARLTP